MGMIKYSSPNAYSFPEPRVSLVKQSSRGLMGSDLTALIKRASDSFADQVKNLPRLPGEELIHVIALGDTERYGCFPAGTTVRQADGSVKNIESIQIGDQVVTHLGRSRSVLNTFKRSYSGEMIELDIAGMLDTVTSTSNHKFRVITSEQVACLIDSAKHCKPGTCQKNAMCLARKCSRSCVRYEPDWVESGSIKVGDYVMIPIPDRSVGRQTWAWSKSMAKMVGYTLAEGSYIKSEIKKKIMGISLCFNINETNLHQDVYQCVEDLREAYPNIKISSRSCVEDSTMQICIRSKALAQRIKRAIGEYSQEKRLNGEVLSQTPEALSWMLAAYYDGDGTCPEYVKPNGYEENRYSAHTASKQLANDVQWVLGKLSVAATVCTFTTEKDGKTCTGHHVDFTNSQGELFTDKMFKHRSAPSDQNKQHSFEWNGYICRPVRSIRKFVDQVDVFNFEVEEDHSYTVQNGIAVKNCNRNGDGFERKVCQDKHGTFVSHGRFYRDHKNTDQSKSYGIPKLSEHDDRTGRVNLVIGINATKEAAERNKGLVADREMDKLSSGQDIAVSMATKVPHDFCSWCDNKARTRANYCTEETCKAGGLKDHIGRVLECGHQLHARNPDGVCWYDISHVDRGADPTAYMLGHLKNASDEKIIGGAEMAERLGLKAPWEIMVEGDAAQGAAVMRTAEKLAQAAKNISKDWYTACRPTGPLPPGAALQLHKLGADCLLTVLAKYGVLLTPLEFAAFAVPHVLKDNPRLIETLPKTASGMYDRFLSSEQALQHAGVSKWLSYEGPIPHEAEIWAVKMSTTHGLDPMSRRAKLASGNLLDLPVFQKSANEVSDGIAETINLHYCLYTIAFANKHHSDHGVHNAVAARSLA